MKIIATVISILLIAVMVTVMIRLTGRKKNKDKTKETDTASAIKSKFKQVVFPTDSGSTNDTHGVAFETIMTSDNDSPFYIHCAEYENEAQNITLTPPALICRISDKLAPDKKPVESVIYDDSALKRGVIVGYSPKCNYYMNNRYLSAQGNFFLIRTKEGFELYEEDNCKNKLSDPENSEHRPYFVFTDHTEFDIANIRFEMMTPVYYKDHVTNKERRSEAPAGNAAAARFSKAMEQRKRESEVSDTPEDDTTVFRHGKPSSDNLDRFFKTHDIPLYATER